MLKFNNLWSSCALGTYLWGSQNQLMRKDIQFRTVSCIIQCTVSHRILRNCSAHSSSVSSVQVASAKEIANKLGVERDSLIDSLKDCPELLNISSLQWEDCFRELTSNGLSAEDSLYMVAKYPPLLRLKTKDLANVFKHWRGVELGEKYVLSLLKTCPQFLHVPGQQVSLRVAHLKPLGSQKEVVSLLKGAPCLMIENWSDVIAKLSFLVDEMRTEKKQVLKSFALNRSLMFLKTRFVFLERCGKYVKPKLDVDPNIPSKNPPLKTIVETDDEKFATQIAGVTLEEYEVFQELYSVETEESEMTDSDSE